MMIRWNCRHRETRVADCRHLNRGRVRSALQGGQVHCAAGMLLCVQWVQLRLHGFCLLLLLPTLLALPLLLLVGVLHVRRLLKLRGGPHLLS